MAPLDDSRRRSGVAINVGGRPTQRPLIRIARLNLVYSVSARERIADKDALLRFLDRIPWDLRTKSYDFLSTPKGFQPRSDAGLRQKEKAFISALTRPVTSAARDNKKIRDALGSLWQCHAVRVCGDGFYSLPTLDSAAKVEPDLDAARAHAKELIELLGPDRACGEIVQSLFWASPFPTYPEWQAEIGALPSEAELSARLGREQNLKRLSDHVDELVRTARGHEAGISDLCRSAAKATEQLEKLGADIAAQSVQNADWNVRLGEQFDGVTSLRTTVQELAGETCKTASALERLTERTVAADESLSTVTNRIDEVETLLLSSVDELRTELRSKAERQLYTAREVEIGAHARHGANSEMGNGLLEPIELIDDPEILFRALTDAFGSRGVDIEHVSRLDIAIRARELPLLIGSHSREVSEAWLLAAAAGEPEIVWTDPTLLSLTELVPSGPRESRAPLARAFALALAQPDRCVVVLLDDFDPAAAGFWLADLARAIRQPTRYGFPENLVCVAIYEGEPAHIALPRQRAGDLFPLRISELSAPRLIKPATRRTAISPAMVAPPQASSRLQDRVDSFRSVAASLIPKDQLEQLVDAFANHLRYMKDGAPLPADGCSLANTLRAASSLISAEPKDKTNA